METDELLEWATKDIEQASNTLTPQAAKEYLDSAVACSLLAIANELKRANDLHEDDRNLEAWKMEHGL